MKRKIKIKALYGFLGDKSDRTDYVTTSKSAWDRSTSVWADWEHLGTDGSMILPFLPALQSPILVVGAGQGMLMEGLLQAGHEVVGIDSSPEMITAAQQRRQIEIQYGSAEELPFDDESFPTIIIQTGVLTERPYAFMQTVMKEGVRVLASEGHLLAGFFFFPATVIGLLQKLGLVNEQMVQSPRYFDLWSAGPDEEKWVQLISTWNHYPTAEAAAQVENFREVLYATYTNWEQFAQPLRDQGQDPAKVLQAFVGTPTPLFTFDSYIDLFTQNGLTVSESYWEQVVNTLTLMGRK
jgi:ubiquinone/menaquinone biosynthesis C-methylase UbiE